MAFQRGTATDYRNLLDQLDKFLTNTHISAIAVNAGGSSYVVGDLLTVLGGTVQGSMPCVIEVVTESAGVIATIRVFDSGAYSVNPSLTANAVTGGTGSGATIDLTATSTGWTNRIKNISSATSVVEVNEVLISNNGIGYAVDDIVTVADSISSVTKATFRVTGVDGSGNVLALDVETGGDYNTVGVAGTIYATTGGTGTGLTINPAYNPVRDEYLWEGTGTGGNAVFIGARSGYGPTVDQRMWELAGFTGFNGSSDWEAQPAISPGRNVLEPVVNINGSALLLSQNAISFWFSVTTRRVIVVANVTGNYQSAYMGLLDPFGTDAEIPYPLFICGTADQFNEGIGSASLYNRGPADPTARVSTNTSGPGYFRDGGATWNKVWNGTWDGGNIGFNNTQDYYIYPTADIDLVGLPDEDNIASSSANTVWDTMIPFAKDSAPVARFKPSPDSGGDLYWPIPCVLMRSKGVGTHKVIGELNGLFWVSAEDGLTVEDKITVGTRVFRVFKMGANALSYAHFCIEEESV